MREVVKSSQQKNGKERNTRVGIVGILTVQPSRLPVICLVVNADSGSVGGGGGGAVTVCAAGHKSPSVLDILTVCADSVKPFWTSQRQSDFKKEEQLMWNFK